VAREPAKRAAITGVAGARAPAVSRVVGRRIAMSIVSLLLNLLWIVFGGLWMALAWVIAAVVMAITIVGLPWARAAFSIVAAAVRLQGRRIFRPRRRRHRPAGSDRQRRVAGFRRMVVSARPPRHRDPARRDHRGHPVRLGTPEARRAGAVANWEGDRAGAD
jgi:membrane protein implicated in regulation of membrane protease activity